MRRPRALDPAIRVGEEQLALALLDLRLSSREDLLGHVERAIAPGGG